VKQSIIKLGLDYRLMTQFTSFVAVEEMIVTDGGKPRRVDVPVEIPEGVNRTAVFGEEDGRVVTRLGNFASNATPKPMVARKQSAGIGSGSGGGYGPGAGGNSRIAEKTKAPSTQPTSSEVADVDEARAFGKLSPADQKRADLRAKVHPSILAVMDRLKANNKVAGADETRFIRGGKAEIQIWFTEKSADVLAKLKQLGFEIVLDPKSARMVIGRLPIEKLAALSELKEVRYIAPQVSAN
jgi:hypothetical protein